MNFGLVEVDKTDFSRHPYELQNGLVKSQEQQFIKVINL